MDDDDPSGTQDTSPADDVSTTGDANTDVEGQEELDFRAPQEEGQREKDAAFERDLDLREFNLRLQSDTIFRQSIIESVRGQILAANARANCIDLKSVVVGEGMADVGASARAYGSSSWQPWNVTPSGPGGRYTPEEEALVAARDVRWLKDKLRQGYTVIDIGRQPGRPVPSTFYNAELQVLSKSAGAKVVRAPRIPGQQ